MAFSDSQNTTFFKGEFPILLRKKKKRFKILGGGGERHKDKWFHFHTCTSFPPSKPKESANRGLPLPLGRRACETKSKKGRARDRKPFMHRVYSTQRGIETMVSDHGLGKGQTMVDPSALKENKLVSRTWQKSGRNFRVHSKGVVPCERHVSAFQAPSKHLL